MSGSNGLQRMIQLFWDSEVENTDLQNLIYVLGRQYKPDAAMQQQEPPIAEPEHDGTQANKTADNPFEEIKNYFSSLSIMNKIQETPPVPWPADFVDDIYSKIWFTYRTQFKPLNRDPDGPSPVSLKNLLRGQTNELNNDHFTSDCGWGCMIRTSQTLLANALLKVHLGPDWKYDPVLKESYHDKIVKWFLDSPVEPFSIHKMVDKGRALSGKKAGEWFGPSAAARSIQALCSEFSSCGIKVYIGSDAGDIYEQDLFKVFKRDGSFKPTLILLGVRLGVENINSIYWDSLKRILSSRESCGISGGRPSSSHYFFGYQADYLFYLDPHFPQPSLEINEETGEVVGLETVHTKKIRKIHISEVDPSMLIGILIQSENEWYQWKSKIQDVDKKNTIIHISPDNSSDMTRRPSFVVYNDDGDDFVDIGYEDLIEEGDDEANFKEDQLSESLNTEQEYERLPDTTEDEPDVSIISVEARTTVEPIPEIAERLEAQTVDDDDSFGDNSAEIKDDYENISTSGKEDDESNTVEVESYPQEEPFLVDEPSISSPEPVSVNKEEAHYSENLYRH